MQSIDLLSELEQIPLRAEHGRYTYKDVIERSGLMRNDLFAIEIAAGVEESLEALFDARNVSDDVSDDVSEMSPDLFEAYRRSSPRVAEDHSLHERYLEMVDEGPKHVTGFISNIKGKLGELRVQEHLPQEFPPGYSVAIVENQNEPKLDIRATSPDGTTKQIQVKVGGEEYAGEVLGRMQEDPDVLFAVSHEIRATVLAKYPELSDQFINSNLSNYELTTEVKEGLDLLVNNSGVDVPDTVGGILPYATEIVLGIRLLCDIVNTERDFEAVAFDDRKRVHAMKALVLFQRFGISAVLTTVGGAAGGTVGSIIPFIGNIIGAIGGAIGGAGLAAYLNSKLRPHMLEIGMELAGVTEDDLFYFKNKVPIDRIGESLARTAAAM